jgi:uncharacterized protein
MAKLNIPSGFALITGASSGIGADFARILAKQGVNLVLVARREANLKELAKEITSNCSLTVHVLPVDIAAPGGPKQVHSFCKANGIEIDYLINNAGFGKVASFVDVSWDIESEMIDLNVKSLVELTKLFGVDMALRGRGRILNVASTAAFLPGPRWAVYFATKAFVLSYSEAIKAELKPHGVTVTTLCPGPTQSEFGLVSGASKTMMFKMSIPTSYSVAKFGIKAMIKGKGVVIHGFKNKVMAALVRFTPRWLLSKVMLLLMDKK